MFVYCGQESATFSSHFHTTWGPPFRDSLYMYCLFIDVLRWKTMAGHATRGRSNASLNQDAGKFRLECLSLRQKKLPKFAHEALTRLTRSCLLCGRRRRQEQESRRPPAFNDVVIPFSSECRRRRQIVGFLFTSTDTPKSCLQPRARWLWYLGWH